MRTEKGFTLIEILIAMAVGLIVLGAIYASLTTGQRSSVAIEQRISTHQDARTALEIMSAEIRMASFNPNGAENMWIDLVGAASQANKGIQLASSTALGIEMDMNGSGAIETTGNSTEVITYRYDSVNQVITRSANFSTAQEFLGDTSAARVLRVVNGATPVFRYFDGAGNPIADLVNDIPKIKRIQITLIVETSQNSPMTGQPVRTIYSTSVIPRNHGITSASSP
jgi:prepilin-type N-terminal cleavage/methylation domain-containing protein